MNELQISAKYGQPGTNQVYCQLPYRMKLSWDPKVTISKFQCNKLIKDNIETLFSEVLSHYGARQIDELGLNIFGGCLNVRNMINGSRPSVHSWGLAIDLDPVNNTLKMNHNKAKFAKPIYDEFWEIVKKNGGYSLGKLRDYDWMHFQFIPL